MSTLAKWHHSLIAFVFESVFLLCKAPFDWSARSPREQVLELSCCKRSHEAHSFKMSAPSAAPLKGDDWQRATECKSIMPAKSSSNCSTWCAADDLGDVDIDGHYSWETKATRYSLRLLL